MLAFTVPVICADILGAMQMNAGDLPDTLDAAQASRQLKRLLLHGAGVDASPEQEEAPIAEVLEACCKDSILPWLVAAAISSCAVRTPSEEYPCEDYRQSARAVCSLCFRMESPFWLS